MRADKTGNMDLDGEIRKNLRSWQSKPSLRRIYRIYHEMMAENLADKEGYIVEIGSGFGSMREVIPDCVCTDFFPNEFVDRIENAYCLKFDDASVSNMLLFDVFHHLEYPGTALNEFHRVLVPGGRVIIFEPYVSLLGLLVYGALHKESLGLLKPIRWLAPSDLNPDNADYYAAQGNAQRIFSGGSYRDKLAQWHILTRRRISGISYIASGGYSMRQLYPDITFGMMRLIDKCCDLLPALFATRVLVVLEKTEASR